MSLSAETIPLADVAKQTLRAATSYVDLLLQEALDQAADLLEYVTKNSAFPAAGTLEYRIVKRGIIALADAIYLTMPTITVTLSPYERENLGQYSYAKAHRAAVNGNPLGLPWWDMAVEVLSGQADAAVSESIHLFDENHGQYETTEGRHLMLGPEDLPLYVLPGPD